MTDVTRVAGAELEERELRREAIRLVRDGWAPCKSTIAAMRVALAGRVADIIIQSPDGWGLIRYERGDELYALPVSPALVERYRDRGAVPA